MCGGRAAEAEGTQLEQRIHHTADRPPGQTLGQGGPVEQQRDPQRRGHHTADLIGWAALEQVDPAHGGGVGPRGEDVEVAESLTDDTPGGQHRRGVGHIVGIVEQQRPVARYRPVEQGTGHPPVVVAGPPSGHTYTCV